LKKNIILIAGINIKMPQIKTTLDAEQEAFDKGVAEIKAWWDSSDKQRQLKRYVV
jgi:hypothetical protein